MTEKQKKKKKKEWPQNLSKKQLVEEYTDTICQSENLANVAMELEKELKKRRIDPWK